jgi:uncharacterized protein (DUF2062 family)
VWHNEVVLRSVLDRARGVLQLDDPPWRIALALAVGVFISCTPTFGFQTLLALLVATLTRLNRAATVTGAWLNLPWVAPFVYAGALKLGQALLPDKTGTAGFWLWLLVGTTLVGAAAAIVTYFVSYGALSWRRRRAVALAMVEDATRGRAAVAEGSDSFRARSAGGLGGRVSGPPC